MQFLKLTDRCFIELKGKVLSYPRLCGYYIIDLVSIENIRCDSYEKLLDNLFEYFDDTVWVPAEDRPSDQTWENDYVVERDVARNHIIEALVGGHSIGHTVDTVPGDLAEDIFEVFDSLFSKKKKYYMGMGLGKPEYVFQQGIAIVDNKKAGIIWIVEND